MRVVVFLDLDDSVFQTRHKCPPGELLTQVTLDGPGQPSFMIARQQQLLELLNSATIIPTTARNLNAFQRVTLTFDSYVILDFGGVLLLPDRSLDAEWNAHIRPRSREILPELNHIHAAMQTFSDRHDLGVRIRIIQDFGMPLYVVAKHPCGNVATLERLRQEALVDLDRVRFFVHANDNNLSIVPRFLGKEHAVRYLIETHLHGEPMLTIGVGDSLTDAAFLDLCDFALLPHGSQLARRLS